MKNSDLKEVFPGVYSFGNSFLTKNLVPGKTVYGEKLFLIDGIEYRRWDKFRSKLASAMVSGLKTWPFKSDSTVLYLGASTGTTVSHVSDIVRDGIIFAVEISAYVGKKLIGLSEIRGNIVPIIEDANKTEKYSDIGTVDVIYEDVATPFQSEILLKNGRKFLPKGGIAMFAVKSQSIDVVADPEETFKKVESQISNDFEVIEEIDISRYHKDHIFLVLRKK